MCVCVCVCVRVCVQCISSDCAQLMNRQLQEVQLHGGYGRVDMSSKCTYTRILYIATLHMHTHAHIHSWHSYL